MPNRTAYLSAKFATFWSADGTPFGSTDCTTICNAVRTTYFATVGTKRSADRTTLSSTNDAANKPAYAAATQCSNRNAFFATDKSANAAYLSAD
jgi:hypothetical protein